MMESAIVNAFRRVMKNVTPSEGKIAFTRNSNRVIVSSTWNQRNAERRSTMHNKFVQLVELDCQEVTNLHSYNDSTELMSSYSPCFEYRGVFRDVPPAGTSLVQKTHLELWQYNKLLKLVDLTTLDTHGDVYTDDEFGCFEWSPCKSKLLYVAEKKKKKSEPFLPIPAKPSENSTIGDEYVWTENWGETLVKKVSPVLAVWDSAVNEVSILSSSVPDDFCVGPGLWAPDGTVVCVSWKTSPRRLGKVYCTNRESRLVHIAADGTIANLTKEGLAVLSPKFAHDGSKLVWLEREAKGPHHATMRIMKMDWASKEISTVVDIVQTSTTTSNGEKFFGIYAQNLRNCWLDDNKTIIVSSTQRASTRCYAINTESKEIVDITGCSADDETFSRGVLDVRRDFILSWSSSLLTTPALQLGRYNKSGIEWITLVDSKPTLTDFIVDIIRMESNVVPDLAKDFSAIYCGPKAGKDVPLIVFPHGGPHSASANSYSALVSFFGCLGFATLLINYRGSIGAGEASVNSLLGNVGTADVSDCHQSALTVLNKYSDVLSKEKCLLFGGSHGGFLVLHLAGQYPSFYKSVATRNPVFDLPSVFFTSDIPDWALVESGMIYSPKTQIDETWFARMRKMSPIYHVEKIKTPVLFLIGKADRRVPPSQGINCHLILKENGIKTKLLAYKDNHGLPKTPHEIDFSINTILWFLESIQHDIPQSE